MYPEASSRSLAPMNKPVPERVRDVRARYDLRDYIAQEMNLDRRGTRGRSVQMRCPFHADSNPSMTVYEGNYYCHGCREHGDIIDWVQHRDGSDFFVALEMLEGPAALQDVPYRPQPPVQPKPDVQSAVGPERLRRTLQALVEEGMAGLDESPAQDYCFSRGWGQYIQDAYQLGYFSFRSGDSEAFADTAAFEELGLNNRNGWPWFNDRLFIPLCDPYGRPVAIATRVLKNPKDGGPRYINSRRSALFHRDEMIYGAHLLPKSGMRYFWVVEGYADAWSLHEIGVPAVAVMSDRLSEYQVEWLGLAAQTTGARIVLAFDGDAGGQEGERLSYARLAAQSGVSVSRLALRGGVDVSGIIEQRGRSGLSHILNYLEARS